MAMQLAQTDTSLVDAFVAVKLAVALQNFWILRGYATEGRAAVRAMLAHPAVQAAAQARAHALYVGAALAYSQSDLTEALRMLQDCLALRRQLAHNADIAATLSTLAVTLLASGDADSARAACTEALQLVRDSHNRGSEAITLVQLGQVEAHQDQAEQARQHLAQALAIAQEIGHPETEAEAELVLGELAMAQDHTDTAQAAFARSLAICRSANDPRGTALAEWALARVDLQTVRGGRAAEQLCNALLAFDGFEMREAWLGCLEDHAAQALWQGRLPLAIGLAAAADRLRTSARLQRAPQAQRRWQRLLETLRAAGPQDSFDAAWASAQGWDHATAQRLALQASQPLA